MTLVVVCVTLALKILQETTNHAVSTSVGGGKDRGFYLKKGSFVCIYGNRLDPLVM